MRSIEEVVDRLIQLTEYRYNIERYLASLRQLTIIARPMQDTYGEGKSVYINFVTVKYLQMPTYWEGAPFELAQPDECRAFLDSIGIEVVKRLPLLFYAQLPKSHIYVVCGNVEVFDEMPLIG